MSKNNYSYTQLGMLFGTFIGGGFGIILFSTTMNPIYFTIIGMGTGIGLVSGAILDRIKDKKEK